MAYGGMLDEVDEGTAIYKVANTVPVGKYFATYEGLPADWYLKLTGAATRMIRGERPGCWISDEFALAAATEIIDRVLQECSQ